VIELKICPNGRDQERPLNHDSRNRPLMRMDKRESRIESLSEKISSVDEISKNDNDLDRKHEWLFK
jgi:hypothetical protein